MIAPPAVIAPWRPAIVASAAAVVEKPSMDLSWVMFAEDDIAPPCDWGGPAGDESCTLEAVAKFIWDRPCGHGPSELRYCADHRDLMMLIAAQLTRRAHCHVCNAVLRLIRVEPIR